MSSMEWMGPSPSVGAVVPPFLQSPLPLSKREHEHVLIWFGNWVIEGVPRLTR
jgi:hypothetical protein